MEDGRQKTEDTRWRMEDESRFILTIDQHEAQNIIEMREEAS
jgi:hypothetical protein